MKRHAVIILTTIITAALGLTANFIGSSGLPTFLQPSRGSLWLIFVFLLLFLVILVLVEIRGQSSAGTSPPNSSAVLPATPAKYVAHEYALPTRTLVGRKDELKRLTKWLAGEEEYSGIRVLAVHALGGMGKSALTWTWFHNEGGPSFRLSGRMWWSFYAPDASFDSFLTHAVAYSSKIAISEAAKLSFSDREQLLLRILRERRFLLVLDGLERLLIQYNRMDAANLPDYVPGGEHGSDADADGEEALPSATDNERRLVDYRVGEFLQACAAGKSQILITSRLYPADLEQPGGGPVPGCAGYHLTGLNDADALELWAAMGAKGSSDQIQLYLKSLGNQPLWIDLLAGAVKQCRRDPGNFDLWLEENPRFNPASLPLQQRKTHILRFAFDRLSSAGRRVLSVITAFRTALDLETATELLVRLEAGEDVIKKPFATKRELDRQMNELEDRGLLGWDGKNFELHPVIRANLWRQLKGPDKSELLYTVANYAESKLQRLSEQEGQTEPSVKWAVERFYALVGLCRWVDAYRVFADFLDDNLYYLLGRGRDRQDILDHLLRERPGEYRRITGTSSVEGWFNEEPHYHALILYRLAKGAMFLGDTGMAVRSFQQAYEIVDSLPAQQFEKPEKVKFLGEPRFVNTPSDVAIMILSEASHARRLLGQFRDAEWAARKALLLSQAAEYQDAAAVNLYRLGLILSARGESDQAEAKFRQSLFFWEKYNIKPMQGFVNACLAHQALQTGKIDSAHSLAQEAWRLFSEEPKREINTIHGYRLLGMISLARAGDGKGPSSEEMQHAYNNLHESLNRARTAERIEEILLSLISIAELDRRGRKLGDARRRLAEIWELDRQKSYPWFYAEAFNILTLVERDSHQHHKASLAATEAFKLSWCDGPPFAYHWALATAKQHLAELKVAFPEMLPFDDSKFPPMPFPAPS